MQVALEAARSSLERGDLPIGAAIYVDGELVATGSNAIASRRDESHHAEMDAISKCAPTLFDNKRGGLVELYTTMEPCLMCAGAIAHFRIDRVVYALTDPHAGVRDMLVGHRYYDGRGTSYDGGIGDFEAWQLLEQYAAQVNERAHILELIQPPASPRS